MEPANLKLPTARRTFAFMLVATWVTNSAIVFAATSDAMDFKTAALAMLYWSGGTMFFGCFAAISAAVLALLLGADLSRQFCWMFSVMCGLMAPMVVAWGLVMGLYFTSLGRQMYQYLPTQAVPQWAYVAMPVSCVAAGIVLGVLMTRGRLGFSRPSRRAARIGAVSALLVLGAGWLLARLMEDNEVRLKTGGSGEFWMEVWIVVGFVFVSAALPAVFGAQRRQTGSFHVLPVDAPL
ncbi:MAG: hypothetical protein ACREJC_12990 [Tepidisphaeraceae bacterium]